MCPAGALVGPPWSKRQNGYVMREGTPQPASLYYEPHCDFDESSVRAVGKVDMVRRQRAVWDKVLRRLWSVSQAAEYFHNQGSQRVYWLHAL